MNPYRGLKEIPHNIWILAFATLINRSGTMVLPFLAIYMAKDFGVSAGSAGLVLAFYGFGALLTAPIVGKLSDKLGALRVMKLSLVFTGLMLFAYPFITDYYLILGYTVIWSVVSEAFRPANLSLISTESEPAKRKISFALNRLAINLGMSIGPVVGGILTTIDFKLLFYVDGVTSIVAGIFLMIARFDTHESYTETNPAKTEEGISSHGDVSVNGSGILKDKVFLLFLFSLIPVNIVFFQHIGGLPLYIVRDLEYSGAIFGILSAINTVIIIFIEVPLNNAMAAWDDRRALALGALLCGIGFGLMVISENIFFISFTIVIWTFGEMIFFPASTSYTSALSPPNKRGEYMGYFQMTFSLALMIGPWLGTEVLDLLGADVLWLGSFLFSSITALMFLFFKDKSVVTNNIESK
ncbi:MAG TPA: MFS transporter [Melioribacteraceae bacterium]|nr:MFS transporter [Melioribacteraceae bacterium]